MKGPCATVRATVRTLPGYNGMRAHDYGRKLSVMRWKDDWWPLVVLLRSLSFPHGFDERISDTIRAIALLLTPMAYHNPPSLSWNISVVSRDYTILGFLQQSFMQQSTSRIPQPVDFRRRYR